MYVAYKFCLNFIGKANTVVLTWNEFQWFLFIAAIFYLLNPSGASFWEIFLRCSNDQAHYLYSNDEQAGTGPSRRHMQGSKLAKRHQSFKVFSSTALNCFWKKSQRRKKIERRTLWGKFFPKKSRNAEKNWKGGPFGLVRHCMLCGILFGSVPWANRWNLKFCRTFGRTILVSSEGLKKTLTKSHDYSRLFSLEKRRLKKTFFRIRVANKFKLAFLFRDSIQMDVVCNKVKVSIVQ